jgi:hypothetical protein
MEPKHRYLSYILYQSFVARYGYTAALWRAFENWELYQQWLAGLLTSQEALRLYWNLQI